MNTSDFFFDLPAELIAQTPIAQRERSRLLCVDRHSGKTDHKHFYELPGLLREGDCLVLNDSRVLPARLLGRTEIGGAAEVVLLHGAGDGKGRRSETGDQGLAGMATCNPRTKVRSVAQPASALWECLVRPGRRIKVGTKLIFGEGELNAVVTEVKDGGNRNILFIFSGVFLEILERLGKMPLPPYIQAELEDSERYQTVYSREIGSAAAPTAGLHFTRELLDELSRDGTDICYITLHVGLGTFRPVRTDTVELHRMHSEFFTIPEETAAKINRVKTDGGRVIAVGTTSCRALESCTDESGRVAAYSGSTDIFIYPGYEFRCIDGLITNFHLPESTLIMLVSAFAGRENILMAYDEAIRERYRFFSFGDAMLIL